MVRGNRLMVWLAIAGLLLSACAAPAPNAAAGCDSSGAPPEVGRPAPCFSLSTPDGRTVELAALHGKPLVLNFWATWCGPCRVEMPALQAFYDDHQGSGTHVVAVDIQETAEQVLEYRQSLGITFPTPIDTDGRVTRLYLVRGVPTTFFIDGRGIVRDIHIGPVDRKTLDAKLAQMS